MGGAVAWAGSARGQGKLPTLGVLSTGTIEYVLNAFFKGLSAAGFAEGSNLRVVRRTAAGQFDRLPALAQELVDEKVDVIFANGGPVPTRAAKAATSSIPIVFAYGGDPVADGLVASFNRPGANVTGATFMGASFTSKRLELLKQIVPQAKDVALMLNPKATLAAVQIRDANAAMPALGQRLQVIAADGPQQIDDAFAAMDRQKIASLLVGVDPSYGLVFRDRIVALAARYRIPAMYDARDYIEAGGLISYGTVLPDTWRQAGLYVGRILKGAKPADLPVVQPTKFETVINLATARTLGLQISPDLLANADDTIE